MMVFAKRYTPNALVSFTTEQGQITLRADISTQGYAIDSDVISISTNNDISVDAGTFQIELTRNRPWHLILASNDFVRIQLFRDDDNVKPETKATVFMGLIDDVRKSVSLQGGTPQRTITVTGRSFAKALIDFEIGVIQEVAVTESSLGWLMGRITFAGQSAADIIRQVFDELVFKYMDYTFENGKTFKSYTNLKLSSREGERLFDEKSFVNYQGSMQSFLREIANEPFNQMFWECYDDGLATFVLRETPFNPDKWNELPTHIIYDEDVAMDSIGRSDIETYSFFSVGLQNYFSSFDINKTLGVFPYWYEPYYKKYGLRRLHRFTGYVGYGGEGDTSDMSEQLRRYQEDLFNWNIHNPSFFNGFITVRGDNRYKVGDRLLYLSREDNEGMEFFIESVSHEFVTKSHWITKLGVTRGLPNGGEARFAPPWGQYQEYYGGALGTPVIDPTEIGSDSGYDFEFPDGVPVVGNAKTIIEYAKTFIGKTTYVYGGGRNASDIARGRFDCSSWVHYVFKQNGIILGSENPANVNTDVLAKQGVAVRNVSDLVPGDLVFFNTYRYNGHVGIYIGGGKWIGCQSSKGVSIEDLNYWKRKYGIGSMRRVLL